MTASQTDTSSAPLVLQCTSGSMRGQAIPVSEQGLVIGRAGDCGLQVDAGTDVKVSGHHAAITQQAGAFYYTDTGSTNGSLVNGRPVQAHQPVRLDHGATIVLGEDAAEGTVGFTATLAGQTAMGGNNLTVTCPSCAAEQIVSRSMMGRTINCESCGAPFEVPISTKLFSTPDSTPGSGATHAGQAPAPPSTHGGVPPQPAPPGQEQAPGLLGKMRKAVSNFREKRELQDRLSLLQNQLNETRSRAQADAVRLGRSAWESSADQLAELPGGQALVASQEQTVALETSINEVTSQLEEAAQARDTAAAQWSQKCAASSSALQEKQAAHEAASNELAEAERAVRDTVEACLTDAKALSPMIDALQGQDASADPDEQLTALAEAMDRAAELVRAGRGELTKPKGDRAKALKVKDKATKALESARASHQANEQAAAADRATHDAACAEAQGAIEQGKRELEGIKSSLDPSFAELGQALVEQGGAGALDPEHPDLAAAMSSASHMGSLQQQCDEVNARLAEM